MKRKTLVSIAALLLSNFSNSLHASPKDKFRQSDKLDAVTAEERSEQQITDVYIACIVEILEEERNKKRKNYDRGDLSRSCKDERKNLKEATSQKSVATLDSAFLSRYNEIASHFE